MGCHASRVTSALLVRDPHVRAAAIVRRFGAETVAFQGLEAGFEHWFGGAGPTEDAMVSYVDTGGAWVAGGAPVAAPDQVAAAAAVFVDTAAAASRRACFFGAERAFVEASGLPAVLVGEQPVWDTARWSDVLAGASSLRYQLRRAERKGVTVRVLALADLVHGTPTREALDRLATAWQATRKMLPMHFLVALEPFSFPAERVIVVAERAGAVVGVASAIPVTARRRLFIEDFLRAPDAPNGTIELLVDAMMVVAAETGWHELTLGLAPLAGNVARWLRVMRRLATPLYDFAGLRAFKAKLRPHAWEPVYLCAATGGSTLVALRDSLRAFAGGNLLAFGARTLFRRR
jgi:phosphatidylglycerol lysyltransferase